MKKSVCIICGKQKNGLPVEDDTFLQGVRWFKKNVTKNLQGNRLVVCEQDYKKYSDDRKRFESRQRLYFGFAIVFLILSMIVSFRITTFLLAIAVAIVLSLIPYLNYTPKIAIKEQHNK